MRIYDPRVGRFLSVDPLTKQYAHYTPYSYAGNKPITFIDRDGEEEGFEYALDRQQNGLIMGTTKMTPQQIRDGQTARGMGALLGTAIVVDVFLTKGKLSQTLLYSTFASAFNDNRAKTAEGRKQQDNESWSMLNNAFIMYATGEVFNKGFTAFRPVGIILSKSERLGIFVNELSKAAGAGSQEEALSLINKTLDKVEDAYSGVKKASGIPTRDDGRMYGVLDDTYVTTMEDGTKIARTKGNRILLEKDGGFKIQTKDGKTTLFEKAGVKKK